MNLETLTIEVTGKFAKPFNVSTWYRPPGSDIKLFDDFDNFLDKLDQTNNESLILGDFNCNLLQSRAEVHTSKLRSLLGITNIVN